MITAQTSNLIPKFWAFEGLKRMKQAYNMGKTITTEFSKLISQRGDTVHANIPGALDFNRRKDGEDITIQNPTSTDVPVVLNQIISTSFRIYAGQASLSGQELFDTFMPGAVDALNNGVNRAIMGAIPQFMPRVIGGLGELVSNNCIARLVAARRKSKEFGEMGRLPYLAVTDGTEEQLLNNATFVQANTSSDGSQTQRNGYIGPKFNLDVFAPYGLPAVDTTTALPYFGKVNNALGYPVGTTEIAYDDYSGPSPTGSSSSSSSSSGTLIYPPAIGSWVSIAGCREPFKVAAGTTNALLVLDRALTSAIVNDAVIEFAQSTRTSSAYDKDYIHSLDVVDASFLRVGNPVSLNGYNYTVMKVDTAENTVMLDRPLEVLSGANSVLAVFPVGNYNFCYRKDAIAIVNRPLLVMPDSNMYTAIGKDASISVSIDWDYKARCSVVTMEKLIGIKVLDIYRGFLMLG
jgi:hypothetical protein